MKILIPTTRFKSILLSIFFLVYSLHASSQGTTINSINAQLRALFSTLAKPTPSLPFLYDMSAKMSDTVFYQTLNYVDTLQSDMWMKIYDEMYHAAYDTTAYTMPATVLSSSHAYYADTIPMGVMRYSYYKFKSTALTTNTYFNFDTVNTILTDKSSRPGYPYNTSAIFIASPLAGSCDYTNPVFRVDPQFLFLESSLASNLAQGNWNLKIDFGDGLGWITFNTSVVTNYQVNYSGGGEKLIKTAICNAAGTIGNYSQARLYVLGSNPSITPNETWDMPGMIVGVYGGCESDLSSGRIIIYLEGFDVGDEIPYFDRDIKKIYGDQIAYSDIVQLKNDGYTFLVVDWKNSRIDLRFNALYLLNLIEYLKTIVEGDEQLVIMGESMGGLIARYTLTFMEGQQYQSGTFSGFFQDASDLNNILYLATNPGIYDLPLYASEKDKMHNTRLLITLDSPHQGANVPLSVQHAYQTFFSFFSLFMGGDLYLRSNLTNTALDGQAAQQMLIYHVSTKTGTGPYYTYSSTAEKTRFFMQLNAMGNYPDYAKVMAMSQGSLSGQLQRNPYTDVARTPGDDLVDFSSELYAKVLWIKVPIFGGDLECQTDPNGNGHIYKANAGFFTVTIKLKWFGIKITTGYNSFFSSDEYANTLPVSTSPGGYIYPVSIVSETPSAGGWDLSQYWLLNLASYSSTVDGAGCFAFDAHAGFNGFASLNTDVSLCSDGSKFCFVPVQSALDYGTSFGSYSLTKNIQTEGINTKLSRVKADVISGYPGDEGHENHNHTGSLSEPYRNDNILNLTESDETYYSCIGTEDDVERGFLNLEIGDEELYLENVILPWSAKYQTEYDIHVNDRNPYYTYAGQPYGGAPMVEGVYSKKTAFTIQSPGYADFHYDGTGSPTSIGLNYSSPVSASYSELDEPLYVCCYDFIGEKQLNPSPIINSNTGNYLLAYPNPNNGGQVFLNCRLSDHEKTRIEIFNAFGEKIYSRKLNITDPANDFTINVDLWEINLTSGFYLIRVLNGHESVLTKMIIQR